MWRGLARSSQAFFSMVLHQFSFSSNKGTPNAASRCGAGILLEYSWNTPRIQLKNQNAPRIQLGYCRQYNLEHSGTLWNVQWNTVAPFWNAALEYSRNTQNTGNSWMKYSWNTPEYSWNTAWDTAGVQLGILQNATWNTVAALLECCLEYSWNTPGILLRILLEYCLDAAGIQLGILRNATWNTVAALLDLLLEYCLEYSWNTAGCCLEYS